ncbi:NAD-dependent epimerase/dehydratase family protein [Hymenobacter sp. BT770]|uniref:NAD-dependent epimerase/dehydratase family protein n=1 Tax=Hymenobacter sp. BT770 TaxID=2886942 RepID=UPI001D124B93|nr:NAD-dependent epimerase/dehydratase family protein [Hymenobacter sp. BT770]MCC3155056.1 NAD-dependent epimerase/dehydratase family protein [Hymenobacter sp. BT770]MDO3417001.1 NAD-dependent epimerase/dehydratase family protein [Hymenobacter sp. BT770]
MKIVLFGASGFAGRNVADMLRSHEVEFVGASLTTGLDLRDTVATAAFLREHQPTHIINCAAHVGSLNYVTEKAATVVSDNSRMVLGMYEAVAQECPKALVVNPIANCAYPATADIFKEDEWWNGHLHRSVLSYGTSRRLLWAVAECFQLQYGIRSIHLLTPNMYGPYDSTDPNKAHALNALISKFVKAGKTNQPELPIWGTGVAIREWLYAPDFARLMWDVLQNPDREGLGQPTNLAQNDGLSVKELVDIIQHKFNYPGKLKWDATKPDGAPKKVMDDKKFREIFPEFKFTGFENGIAETVKYYESVYPY